MEHARRLRCSVTCATKVCSCDGSIAGVGAIRCATTGAATASCSLSTTVSHTSGGFNIHRESSHQYCGESRWRDTHAAFSGAPAVDAGRLFDAFWRGHRRWTPVQRGVRELQLVSNNTRACRHHIRCLYAEAFASASERVYLTTPYKLLRSRPVHLAPGPRGQVVSAVLDESAARSHWTGFASLALEDHPGQCCNVAWSHLGRRSQRLRLTTDGVSDAAERLGLHCHPRSR
jgi:hypothetical protein